MLLLTTTLKLFVIHNFSYAFIVKGNIKVTERLVPACHYLVIMRTQLSRILFTFSSASHLASLGVILHNCAINNDVNEFVTVSMLMYEFSTRLYIFNTRALISALRGPQS